VEDSREELGAMVQIEQIKDEIIVRVIGANNFRLKPQEVEKNLADTLGVPKSQVREAVKDLVEEGELTYVYRDPCNYLEIPPMENHHAARPMEVIFDSHGEPWICDAGVDPARDPISQGCWACGDLAFTRND
jgi:hypothetical protein